MLAYDPVLSSPDTRRISVDDRGLLIEALVKTRSLMLPWTPRPIPLPEECGDDFAVLAARPLEWSVELVVRIGHACHLWRVSPWRIRDTKPLRDEDKQQVADVIEAEVTDFGYRLAAHGNRVFELHVDPVRFVVDVRSSYESPYPYEVFISYKAKDTEKVAARLDELLRAQGFRVWFGPRDIFANYRADIGDGIKKSEVFAVLWSEHSMEGRDEKEMMGSGNAKMSQIEELNWIKDDMKENRLKQLSVFRHSGGPPPKHIIKDKWHVNSRSADYEIDEYARDLTGFIHRSRAAAIDH